MRPITSRLIASSVVVAAGSAADGADGDHGLDVGTSHRRSGRRCARGDGQAHRPGDHPGSHRGQRQPGALYFPNVPPGVYDLSVTLQGFKTSAVTGVVSRLPDRPIRTSVSSWAGVTDEVTVTATAETLIIKRDSSVGNTIERERLMLLPNLTRDARPARPAARLHVERVRHRRAARTRRRMRSTASTSPTT